MHALVKEKAGRKPFREIKTMKEDPAGVEQDERGDQGALQQAVRGVKLVHARAANSGKAPAIRNSPFAIRRPN